MELIPSSIPECPIQTHNEYLIHHLTNALSQSKDDEQKSMLKKCLDMAQGLETYLDQLSPSDTKLQEKIFADTLAGRWKEKFQRGETKFPYNGTMMNSSHGAHFVKLITEIANAERILEIGTFTGYTTAIFCDADCVKSVTSLELDPYMIDFAKAHFAGTEEEKKLRLIQGPALESLRKLKEAGETFNLVFIDADKSNYINYYKFIMDNNLIGTNGIIVMDNTLWRGELYPEPQGEVAKYFADLNSFVQKDDRVTQVVLQICDGISLVRRK